MPPKIRVIGDHWTPASNTYVNLDCTKTLKENIGTMASTLSVDAAELENVYNIHRTPDKTKPAAGPPIGLGELLSDAGVDKNPILWVKKKVAVPPPKPGAKVPPTKKMPPPPTGTAPAAAAAPGTPSPTPLAKKMPPPGAKKLPPPPKAVASKTLPPKPSAKPSDATGGATPTHSEMNPPSPKNDDSDAENQNANGANGGAGGDNDSDAGGSSPRAAGGSIGFNSAMMGGGGATRGGDDSDNDNNNKNDEPSSPKDDDDVKPPTAAAAAPPAAKKVVAPAVVSAGKKTTFAKKAPTPPPSEAVADAAPSPAERTLALPAATVSSPTSTSIVTKSAPPASSAAAPSFSSSGTASGFATSNHISSVQGGNAAGFDNVAGALAAQRAVDEKLISLQRTLVEEEKKRVEAYENNLRHALAAEVDQIKQSLNSSMQEERARAMQVQQILEEQRTQLLRALAERDGQLQLAQGALQEAVTLGGAKAGPALAAITNKDGNYSAGSASSAELASAMKEQNEKLRQLIQQKEREAGSNKAATRAELDTMVQRQTEMVAAIGQVAAASQSGHSAAIAAERKTLTAFLNGLGLGRFTLVLQQQDIDYEILAAMSDEELLKAGVDTVGARKRILLEFIKIRQQQQQQYAAASARSAADGGVVSFPGGGGFSGTASVTSPGSPNKRVVISEQNNTVHLPPQSTASGSGGGAGSPLKHSHSSPAAQKTPQQLQADVQAQTEAAAALPPKLQDHHRVLLLLFRRAGASDWLSRTAEMVTSFKDTLPSLYEAVAGKLGVPAPNYGPGTGATALKQFISRRFPHLAPAIDVMAFLADGREAEFADTMLLRQLKVAPQRLVWFSVPVPAAKAPDSAEDSSTTAGASGPEKLYFYSALSKLSQWKRPTILEEKAVPKVVLPPKPLDDALPNPGDKLSANPSAAAVSVHRATDQQYVAATVSLLMRHDPARLAQFPQFLKAYERPIAGSEGKEGKINYKGMYLDALQAYGPDDD